MILAFGLHGDSYLPYVASGLLKMGRAALDRFSDIDSGTKLALSVGAGVAGAGLLGHHLYKKHQEKKKMATKPSSQHKSNVHSHK